MPAGVATVDFGTALAPDLRGATIAASPVHVWVDETRPRNQGASLNRLELGQHGVPHTVIPDNTGRPPDAARHVDLVIVGTDRVDRQRRRLQKIGTYLKALAAKDNGVAVLPSVCHRPPSIFPCRRACRDSIEQRAADEVATMTGRTGRWPHRDRPHRARRNLTSRTHRHFNRSTHRWQHYSAADARSAKALRQRFATRRDHAALGDQPSGPAAGVTSKPLVANIGAFGTMRRSRWAIGSWVRSWWQPSGALLDGISTNPSTTEKIDGGRWQTDVRTARRVPSARAP